MKLLFITDRTIKRFKTIEALDYILTPNVQMMGITVDALDEMRTRSHELSKALFGKDITLNVSGDINSKYSQSSFKEEKGIIPSITLVGNTIYVNVSNTSNAFNISKRDKIVLASDIYDKLVEDETEDHKSVSRLLEQVFIDNTFLSM